MILPIVAKMLEPDIMKSHTKQKNFHSKRVEKCIDMFERRVAYIRIQLKED